MAPCPRRRRSHSISFATAAFHRVRRSGRRRPGGRSRRRPTDAGTSVPVTPWHRGSVQQDLIIRAGASPKAHSGRQAGVGFGFGQLLPAQPLPMVGLVVAHLDDNAGRPALGEVTGEAGFEPAQHNGIPTAEPSVLGGHDHVDAVGVAVAREGESCPKPKATWRWRPFCHVYPQVPGGRIARPAGDSRRDLYRSPVIKECARSFIVMAAAGGDPVGTGARNPRRPIPERERRPPLRPTRYHRQWP